MNTVPMSLPSEDELIRSFSYMEATDSQRNMSRYYLMPEMVGFNLAVNDLTVQSERYRSSIQNSTNDSAPRVFLSSDDLIVSIQRSTLPSDLEEQRSIFRWLNDREHKTKRTFLKAYIAWYKKVFLRGLDTNLTDLARLWEYGSSNQFETGGETSAEESSEEQSGSSEEQTSANESSERQAGSLGGQTFADETSEGLSGSSGEQTSAEKTSEGLSVSSGEQTSAKETSEGLSVSSGEQTSAKESSEGLSVSSGGQTSAKETSEGLSGSSRGQTSAKETSEGLSGSSGRQTSAKETSEGLSGSSGEQTSAKESSEGLSVSSGEQTSAKETSEGLSGSSGEQTSAKESSEGLSGSSGEQTSAKESSEGLSGSSCGQTSTEESSEGQAGCSRWPTSAERQMSAGLAGCSRRPTSAEREIAAGLWHASVQERLGSAAASSSRVEEAAESTFRPLGEETILRSMEDLSNTSNRSPYGDAAEVQEYEREVTSERWEENIQTVKICDDTPRRLHGIANVPAPLELSISTNLGIRTYKTSDANQVGRFRRHNLNNLHNLRRSSKFRRCMRKRYEEERQRVAEIHGTTVGETPLSEPDFLQLSGPERHQLMIEDQKRHLKNLEDAIFSCMLHWQPCGNLATEINSLIEFEEQEKQLLRSLQGEEVPKKRRGRKAAKQKRDQKPKPNDPPRGSRVTTQKRKTRSTPECSQPKTSRDTLD